MLRTILNYYLGFLSQISLNTMLLPILTLSLTGKVENLHAHVNRNLQHANPNLHVL